MIKRQQKTDEDVTETSACADSAKLLDSELTSTIKESAQQIWLAGLGAFSKAQAEGGKMFEALVKEGTGLHKKTQGLAEEKLGEVTSRMSSMAGGVQAKAGQQWDKLEGLFEERTAKAMRRLGVPSKKDVDALAARLDELSAKVAALSRTTVARKGAAKKAAAAPRSATAKRAAPKRAR